MNDRLTPSHSLNGERFLFLLIITVGFMAFGLAVIAGTCLALVPSIPHGVDFDAQFTVLDGFFYLDQPRKTAAYQACCLALPILLGGGFWIALCLLKTISDQSVRRINAIGFGLYLVVMLASFLPVVYCPHPPFWLFPPAWLLLPFEYSKPFASPARIICLIAATLLLFYLLARKSRANGKLVTLVLLALWALIVPSRFYLPCEISEDTRYLYHLNAELDALAQSVNGHHLLVNFPHIYGGYVEMLAPFVRLFPRDPGVILAALAIPNVIAILCQLLALRQLVRQPAMQLLGGLALLAVACLSSNEDLYYGYLSARLFFPSLGLLAAALFFQKHSCRRYLITTAICAFAPIWNLDTGLVLFGAWTVSLAAASIAEKKFRDLRGHLFTQIGALAAAWLLFILYLRIASGQWPDLTQLFYFQKLVVGSGYFCLPMLFPDMWIFILMFYLLGLAVALFLISRGHARHAQPVLMLSLLGIGLLSYFMGRSAPTNLILVSWPAVLLAAILCAKGQLMIRSGQLPPLTRFFLLPPLLALFWWSFLAVAAIPDLAHHSAHVAINWTNPNPTPFRANLEFVKDTVKPGEDRVFFVSNHSGLYNYMTATTRSIRMPGLVELMQARDMNILLGQIRARTFAKLFVEQNFYDLGVYRPDVYNQVREAIEQNYHATSSGPDGTLVLYVPN